MDMFMDKLAQKLTAQEIIKANTAAEVEELTKLRNRVAEYNECLDRLQKLIESGEGKLEGAQVNGAEINRLVAVSIEKVKSMQQDATALEQLQGKLTGQMDQLNGKLEQVAGQVGEMSRKLEQQKSGQDDDLAAKLEEKFAGMESSVQKRLDDVELAVAGQLKEKFSESQENMHKECVKVYRNVQAVITENGEQQSDMISHVLGKLSSQKARMKVVMGVTITTLILTLCSIALQIFSMLNVKLF